MSSPLLLQRLRSYARSWIGRAGVVIAAVLLCAMLAVTFYPGTTGQLQAAPGDPPKPISAQVVPPTQVGMVFSIMDYWTTDEPFVDVVKTHGHVALTNPWKTAPASMLDKSGHPVHIPRGTEIGVVLRWNTHSPVDAVDCVMSPGWSKRILGNGTISGGDQRFRVSFGARAKDVWLMLSPTIAFSDLTTLACRAVGAPREATFLPVFLDDTRPFRVLRFMDWMGTNNAPLRNWADRPTPANFAQVREIAIEHMVELANTAKADPWFNMPLDASPDYYRAFATYVRDHLAPDRKVYVELSNEVWNTAFKQGRDAVERGKSVYPGTADPKAGDFYYADRLQPMMAIWSEVFAGQTKRLIRVAAAQSEWAERAENVLSHNQAWRSVDMLATAPYFGANGGEVATNDPQVRINALFASGAKAVDVKIKDALAAKATAAKYGLRYGTYEGGPGYFNRAPPMQAQLNDLERDPRMYDLYSLFLERWRNEVGGLYVAYSSVGEFAQYGAWGHKEYAGQPLSEAPKMRALVNFIDRNKLNR